MHFNIDINLKELPILINKKSPSQNSNIFNENKINSNILEVLDSIKSINDIEEETQIPREELLALLVKLELKGKVENLHGAGYRRI